LARSLSSKEQKIQDLEKALTKQRKASEKKISDIIERLTVLFGEYERSLNEFGVYPAPLPSNLGLPEFMDWIDAEFEALPEVIFGANDFAAAFSIESILKLLHDFTVRISRSFAKNSRSFPTP
jgi:hypothetical protein